MHARRHPLAAVTVLVFLVALGLAGDGAPADHDGLVFDPSKFTLRSATLEGKTIEYRAYEAIVYVRHPVDAVYQCMNIFVPTAYLEGRSIGNYDAKTAPIFFPNAVGGYMPARPGSPGPGFGGGPNASLVALSKGFVVAFPGARGRSNRTPRARSSARPRPRSSI